MPQTEVRVFKATDGSVPLEDWLNELESSQPRAYAKCVHAILELSRLGYELRRPMADSLRDGICELRVKLKRVHYRLLYFFHGRNVVVLSHGFTKEAEVPKPEIDRAIRNKLLVEQNAARHTAEWELT